MLRPDQVVHNFVNQIDTNLPPVGNLDGVPYLYCGWFYGAFVDFDSNLVVQVRKNSEEKFTLPKFPEKFDDYNVRVEYV